MEAVDYTDTFIAVADDCPAVVGTPPPVRDNPSTVARFYALISGRPYELTSADVIFTAYADRNSIPAADRDAARSEFYAKSRACLRSSDLGKRYGWGIHADTQGRLALYGVDTAEYAALVAGRLPGGSGTVRVTKAMRSRR